MCMRFALTLHANRSNLSSLNLERISSHNMPICHLVGLAGLQFECKCPRNVQEMYTYANTTSTTA